VRMPSGRIALVAITRRGAQQAGALARSLVAASPLLPTPSPLTRRSAGEDGVRRIFFLPPPSRGRAGERGRKVCLPLTHASRRGLTVVPVLIHLVSAASPSENTSRVDLVIAAKFAPTAAESAWPSLSPPDPAATVEPLADDAPTSAPGPSPRLIPYPGALKDQIGPLFATYDQIVFFVSLGAVIRLIAPHLQSKHQDPGVLVVDEAGRFVIPALSGHVGGANAFAEHLAGLLGATAVLTTASDVGQTLAVDLLGRELGWRLEAPKINVTRVSAHVVNGEPIALVQEAGRRDWWCRATPPPANIQVFARFEDIDPEAFRGLLWVTRRAISLDLWQRFAERLVVYRPPEDQP
jgi:cobalt-precorrin 5A hydrolase